MLDVLNRRDVSAVSDLVSAASVACLLYTSIPADADRTGRRQVFRVRLDDQFATVHFLIAKPDNGWVAAKMLVQHSHENGVAIAKYLIARSEKAEAVPADIVLSLIHI